MNDSTRIEDLAAICRRAALAATGTNAALGAGALYGRILWHNPLGPVGDDAFETAILGRHGSRLTAAAGSAGITEFEADWLHVVSDAYDAGGHTPLLEFLLAIQAPKQGVGVVVTNSHTARFAERCAELDVPVHRLRGGLANRAIHLIALGRRAERIMLHINPDDLASAIAARILRDEGRTVVFLNHADHIFGFGHGAANVVAELSGFGWRMTAERRVAQGQHFLGIPAPPTAPAPGSVGQSVATGPILSVGSAYKYKPDGALDFPAFLMELMDRTDRRVEIIGPRPDDPWWQPVLSRHGDRLSLPGPLPFRETQARIAGAACYVDSFPVSGGTALTQGLMAGKTIFAPPYPAGGYGLADTLRAPSIESMTGRILEFLATGKEPAEQAAMRRRIAEEFGPEAIERRLTRLEQGAADAPPEEMLAAARDLDYFATGWRRSGSPVFVPSRQARPDLGTRIALTARVLAHSGFRRPSLPLLLGWTLLGPPPAWSESRHRPSDGVMRQRTSG